MTLGAVPEDLDRLDNPNEICICLSFRKKNMLINNKAFNGTTFHFDINRKLGLYAENTSCFTTFRPVQFPSEDIIYRFLHLLFKLSICCFMCGTFTQYTADIFDDFEGAILFVALTDNPLLRLIFQKHDIYIDRFNINEFDFLLTGIKPGYDVFQYVVSCKNFSMLFLIIGINTSQFCNPLSNVDFVHFMWDNYRRFNFKKYAITLLPSTTPSLPQMLCLQYYRAKSDGWKDYGNCDDCVQENIRNLLSLSHCRQPDICCSCNICKRQPPSLVHSRTFKLHFNSRTI